MILFVKKIPAVEHFNALVDVQNRQNPPNRQKPISYVIVIVLKRIIFGHTAPESPAKRRIYEIT